MVEIKLMCVLAILLRSGSNVFFSVQLSSSLDGSMVTLGSIPIN